MTFSIDSDKVETDNALINIDSNSHTQFKDKRGNALIEFATDINFKDTAGNFHDIGVKNMYMDDIDGTMVDHVNASDAHHVKYTDSEAVAAVNNSTDTFNIDISGDAQTLNGNTVSDFLTSSGGTISGDLNVDNSGTFGIGSTPDITIEYDSANEQLVFNDSDDITLLQLPKGGPVTFTQGANIGPLNAPSDTYTEIIDAGVSSNASTGDTVGYNFALDDTAVLSIEGSADGSGGMNTTSIDVSADITAGGTTIWDDSAGQIPGSVVDLQGYSDSEAITAVESETTLQLSGDLTVSGTITEQNSI